MAKRTKLGAAGATVLRRRTGADALAAATAPPRPEPAAQWGKGRNQAGYKTTTVRLEPPQWMWLRRQALGRAMESGTAADASEIMRELVAAAMTKDNGKR
jgi:hypothetical protein